MKKIIALFLIVILSTASIYAAYNKKEVKQITKANNFYGYKGKIKVVADSYDENYGLLEETSKNEDIVYDAYLDMIDKNNQSIMFYASSKLDGSPHAPRLEVILKKGSLTVIYDDKNIYDKKNSSKKDIENVMAILYQYPDFIVNFFFNYSYYDGVHSRYILNEAILSNVYKMYYDMSISEYNYFVLLEVDDKYRITSFSVEDNTDWYSWENNVPYQITISTMSSSTEIYFLDEDGWLK